MEKTANGLSLSAFCKTHNLDRASVLSWLQEQGYVKDIRTPTEKGLQSGISICYGQEYGQWPVYSGEVAKAILAADLEPATETFPSNRKMLLKDLSKKLGVKRDILQEWLHQEGYLRNAKTATKKGKDAGILQIKNAYSTVLYYTKPMQVFLQEKAKAGAFDNVVIPEKRVAVYVEITDTDPKKNKDSNFEFTELGLPKDFVILDTETTGLTGEDEIVELGIVAADGEELYNGLFCPERRVNPSAAKVTGITNEVLKDKPKFEEEWQKIQKLLEGKVILGHNVKFDKRLLLQTTNRYGIIYDWENLHQFIDTMDIAKQYMPEEDSYKLERLCEALGIEGEQTHRAVDDCIMTIKMLRAIELATRQTKEEQLQTI